MSIYDASGCESDCDNQSMVTANEEWQSDSESDSDNQSMVTANEEGHSNFSTHTACTACTGLVPEHDTVTLTCLPEPHTYCPECLETIFSTSLDDHLSFPPKCYGPIPISSVRHLLSSDIQTKYDARIATIEADKIILCSAPTCDAILLKENTTPDTKVAWCTECASGTCSLCKQPKHKEGTFCTMDQGTNQVLAIAERERWRQRPSCNALIELNTGCNHITCLCKAEFCYTCGKLWQNDEPTCSCDLFDETQLVAQRRREIDACNHLWHEERQDIYSNLLCDICPRRGRRRGGRGFRYMKLCYWCECQICFQCIKNKKIRSARDRVPGLRDAEGQEGRDRREVERNYMRMWD